MHALSLAAIVLGFTAQATLGYVVPRKDAPSTYAEGYLEPYQQYHTRYLAIGCQFQHNNATFFNACCHPMLATETLETARPAYCRPSASASSSASAAQATSTDTDDDNEGDDCDEGDEDQSSSSTPTPSTITSQSTSATPSSTPKPTSTHKPKPKPTPSPTSTEQPKQPAPTSSSVSQPKPDTTDTASGSSQVFTGGHATFFYQNGVAGACGTVHSDSDMIVALDQQRYGDSGARSQFCGKTVAITGRGKTEYAVVADDCPTCDNENSLDMSVGLFNKFATPDVGEFDISWQFVN
jgi:hypothetical protein